MRKWWLKNKKKKPAIEKIKFIKIGRYNPFGCAIFVNIRSGNLSFIVDFPSRMSIALHKCPSQSVFVSAL